MAVQLDGIPFRWNGPATEWELFGIVRLPDLDLVNVLFSESLLPHEIGEAFAEVVGVVLTHQQPFFSADDHFQEGDEIVRDASTQIGLEFSQDGGQIGGRDVLGSIDSEP